MRRWPVLLAERNLTRRAGLAASLGEAGESCAGRCRALGGRLCDEDALNFTQFADCATLRRAFAGSDGGGCRSCDYAVHRKSYPGPEAPAMVTTRSGARKCVVPFWHDPRLRPSCDASHPDARRLCPCRERAAADPERWDGTPLEILH